MGSESQLYLFTSFISEKFYIRFIFKVSSNRLLWRFVFSLPNHEDVFFIPRQTMMNVKCLPRQLRRPVN